MTEEMLNEGLALVQLYPGPIMVDLTAYVGYRLRGMPGAVLATAGFVLPSFRRERVGKTSLANLPRGAA